MDFSRLCSSLYNPGRYSLSFAQVTLQIGVLYYSQILFRGTVAHSVVTIVFSQILVFVTITSKFYLAFQTIRVPAELHVPCKFNNRVPYSIMQVNSKNIV